MIVTVRNAIGREENHAADWVDVSHRDPRGNLHITLYDEHDEPTGWTIYATGMWASVSLTEPASEDTQRRRAAVAARQAANPPNRPNAY